MRTDGQLRQVVLGLPPSSSLHLQAPAEVSAMSVAAHFLALFDV